MIQQSFWEKESFFSPQEIIIEGSGFVGLWRALHPKLENPSYKITILERGVIPTGASTRNAGFSCIGSAGELITDRWSSIMAKGTEKIPIKQSFDKNVFCCVRMSGMGVALAPLAAMEVVTLMNS